MLIKEYYTPYTAHQQPTVLRTTSPMKKESSKRLFVLSDLLTVGYTQCLAKKITTVEKVKKAAGEIVIENSENKKENTGYNEYNPKAFKYASERLTIYPTIRRRIDPVFNQSSKNS